MIVSDLAEQGMLSRAIAPVVGTSHVTVKNDLDSSVKDFTDEHPAPRAVHGRDGITRTFQPRTAPEPVTVDHETGVDGGVRVWVSRNVTPMCYSNGYDDFGPRVRAV